MNNLTFGGIKLSKGTFEHAKKVNDHLNTKGFNGLGFAELEMGQDTLEFKSKDIQMVRENNPILKNDFTAAFLHYCDECYIVGRTLAEENKMIKAIKEVDEKAQLNLRI